jgi:predicted transposase YbfD/YdcC
MASDDIETQRQLLRYVVTAQRHNACSISSLKRNVKRFARSARGHWSIKSTGHWSLDMTFREHESRTRDRNVAEILFGQTTECALALARAELVDGSSNGIIHGIPASSRESINIVPLPGAHSRQVSRNHESDDQINT